MRTLSLPAAAGKVADGLCPPSPRHNRSTLVNHELPNYKIGELRDLLDKYITCTLNRIPLICWQQMVDKSLFQVSGVGNTMST